MTRVFDASAVLAAIFDEPGGERVTGLWADGENIISTVNYAEVISKLAERGMTDAEIRIVMEGVPLKPTEFDQEAAHAAGLLRRLTKALGLSLGDRACLALARGSQCAGGDGGSGLEETQRRRCGCNPLIVGRTGLASTHLHRIAKPRGPIHGATWATWTRRCGGGHLLALDCELTSTGLLRHEHYYTQ